MARLDRLMTGKVIAQLGATLGRQFSYALLQAVAQLNERTLHEELHRLVEAELCTKEVYHHNQPTCLSMHLFRMLPTSRY